MAPGMRPPGPPGMAPPQGMYRDEGGAGRPPHHNVIEKGPDIKRFDGMYTSEEISLISGHLFCIKYVSAN